MSTAIISDIHENIWGLEKILKQAGNVDHYVFTGDWVDRHHNQLGNLEATMQWLKDHKDDEDKTFLLGNHDLNYLRIHKPWAKCSGYSWQKESQIDPLLFRNFKLTTEVEGWTLSHAGFYDAKFIDKRCEQALTALWRGEFHPLLGAGWARGGDQALGGCLWMDWNYEFQPVDGLKQIVGHTVGKEPRWKGDNLCLDTQLKHYAIIEDGAVKTYEVKKVFDITDLTKEKVSQ